MRGQKITLGEMRSSGARGLLVYCADYQCALREGSARIDGRTIIGCLILNRYSYVRRVADEAPISGLTGTGDWDTQPKACRTPIGARALRATLRTRRRAFCALPLTRAPPRVAPSETA